MRFQQTPLRVSLMWRLAQIFRGLHIPSVGRWRLITARKIRPVDSEVILLAPQSDLGLGSGGEKRNSAANTSEVGFDVLDKAFVTNNRRVSAVIVKNELLLPRSAQEGPWNLRVGNPATGGIRYQVGNELLVDLGSRRPEIPGGIFVGSWSAHNWYHWIFDTLPSIFLAQSLPPEFDHFPVLIPETQVRKAAWEVPLERVLAGRSRVVLPTSTYLEVLKLVWIESPTTPGPLPLASSSEAKFSVREGHLSKYRSFMLDAFGAKANASPKDRIFLGRRPSAHRPYNQDELLVVAEKYGFRLVLLEEMSFEESVAVMQRAEYVVGPHGAGWASTLFCSPRVKGFLWSWQGPEWNWFLNVAKVAGFHLHHYVLPPQENPHYVNPSTFESWIHKLLSDRDA